MTHDFTNNVAIQDAHDEKGQCNMVEMIRSFCAGVKRFLRWGIGYGPEAISYKLEKKCGQRVLA